MDTQGSAATVSSPGMASAAVVVSSGTKCQEYRSRDSLRAETRITGVASGTSDDGTRCAIYLFWHVEVDETYVGGKWRKRRQSKREQGSQRGRGITKQPIFRILCKRDKYGPD